MGLIHLYNGNNNYEHHPTRFTTFFKTENNPKGNSSSFVVLDLSTPTIFFRVFGEKKNNCATTKFQVSQNGLDVVSLLIERLGNGFRPYLNTTLPPALDRLGDTRETVREKAHYLITKLMEEEVVEPQPLFEKMQSAFTHKNGKVREEILILMQNTLNV